MKKLLPLVALLGVTTVARAPRRAAQGRHRRGHHRVRARQRSARAPVPRHSKSTVTVNVTYLVGSRLEGYGETGMAHLLEHMMFKGTPRHPKIWTELRRARRAASTARPGTTAPTTSRRCPPPTTTSMGARARSRSHGQLARSPQEDLKHGVLGRAQRVRDGREQAGASPRGAHLLDRVPLAQLRQVDDRLAQRHRARAGRRPAGRSTRSTTSPTTRC